jgi:type I restriction enzyme R subunit
MAAIDLLQELGWSFKNLYSETLGEQGTEGRESEHQVILTRRLLKDCVKVSLPDAHGQQIETLRVIDWSTPTNNDFFLASQLWVAGDMYRRRCDLLGFVNGLPLVFIELKKSPACR